MARGVLPYNSDGGARRKISRTPLKVACAQTKLNSGTNQSLVIVCTQATLKLKGTRILFYGRVPKSFPHLRGTNSTTTKNITGTANFNSNIGFFESIALNLYPNKAYRLWQQTY